MYRKIVYLCAFVIFLQFHCVFAFNLDDQCEISMPKNESVTEEIDLRHSNINNFFKGSNLRKIGFLSKGRKINLKIARSPCGCFPYQCGCCITISFLFINEQVCANITYDPFLFAIILDVKSNNNTIIHNVISGKNPPPFCAPLALPNLIPFLPGIQLDLCIKLFNIYTPAVRNFHICMDWELKIFSTNFIILHFDCLRIGADGTAILKPGDDGNLNFGPPIAFPFAINETIKDIIQESTEKIQSNTITLEIEIEE